MQKKITISFTLGLLLLGAGAFLLNGGATAAATGSADAGKTVFDAKCGICHKIGEGDQPGGPDLEGITGRRNHDWLVQMITAPDQVIASGDPDAAAMVAKFGFEMPNLGITLQEAEDILTYLGAGSDTPTPSAPATTTPSAMATATPTLTTPSMTVTATPTPAPTPKPAGNADAGLALFTGETRLQNGGGACIACHNVDGVGAFGGGTLANDMTDVYARLGAAGLTSIMKTTPFPVMKDIFGSRPLTDEEIADLVAFFQEASRPAPIASGNAGTFVIIGIAGVIVLAIIFQLAWRKRISGVRRKLVAGGQK